MEKIHKELLEREAVLKQELLENPNDPFIKGQIYENMLVIIRTQQILLNL
jgi:hypothetical protein